MNLLRPLYGPTGELDDFALEYLNPAAQRMTGLPEQPGGTTRTRFPDLFVNGTFEFYRQVFETGEAGVYHFNYQADGFDNYFHVAARRSGEMLVVSFTDTADQSRSPVEQALRESQAEALAARAEAEQQRQRFYEVLQQLPAQVATYHGPEHVYHFVNAAYQRYFSQPPRLLGHPIRQVLPEAEQQGILALMDQVYQTGEPHYAPEQELWLDFAGQGTPPQQVFINLLYHPLRDAHGHVTGLLDFSTDVTEQVLARRQVEQLNQELEARVQARTQQLEQARLAAERQRRQEEQLLWQAPAAICIFDGPEWVYQFVNPGYQAIFPGQPLLGRPLLAVFPELADQPLLDILRRVYDTGEPFQGTEVLVPLARTADGSLEDIYFDLTYLPRRNEQGEIDGFITYAYDVTERVRARQQAEADAQRLRLLTDALPVLIGYLDREERYRFTNEAYRAWFNQDPQALLGHAVRDIVGEAAYANVKPYIDRALAGERLDFESRMPYREGFVKYIRTSYVPDVQGGELRGFYTLVTDITEQVLARQQVEQINQELETHVQVRTQEAQEARAAAERQRGELERVFEQAPVAIAVYRGPRYVIELANATVARLWGRTQEQLIGKGLFEALPEVAGLGYEQLLDGVMATGVPYVAHAMEAQHERDGHLDTVYWDFVYVPLYAADGRIDGAMVVATEVTDQVLARRQMEQLNQELEARVLARTQELADNQRLLNQILAQVPAAITTLQGPEHRFTFANNRYQQLVDGRATVGRTVAEVLPEVAEQGFTELLDNVYHTAQTFEGKEIAVLLAQSGQPPVQHYLDFTYQPMPDEHGQTRGLLVFAVDVTEQVRTRRQAEAMQAQLLAVAQHQAAERLAFYQIFEQTPALVALLRSPGHRFEYVNPAYQALFPGRQLLGRDLAEAAPEAQAQGLVTRLDHVYETGETYDVKDVPFTTASADGQSAHTVYFTFTYQAYRENGQVAGISIFAFDVTAQVLARQQVQALNEALAASNQEMQVTNEELHDANTQLTRTNADLDTFVYAASHDLKAPIANIEGLLDALRDYLPSHEQEPMVPRLVGMMEGAIRRFQQTVAHLTDVARLQHSTGPITEEVDVADILEDVRLDLWALLESTHTELHLHVPACPGVRVPAKHLRSILFNLLSNAVKYRAPDRVPHVQVRAQCAAGRFVLAVQDNGLGLSAQQQGQLFTMFRRLHTHVEGSGVGLYLIKRMIELAGGTITVESQPGVGSTFTVTLPAA
ncbi:hypothetical protein N008_11100 [Hymenobacter sp. APR13]|nr:hypothetical protein N008_11100 [Hymenobacter sp. APR13]